MRYIHFIYSNQHLKIILFLKNLIKSERPVVIYLFFLTEGTMRTIASDMDPLNSVISDSDMCERDIFIAEKYKFLFSLKGKRCNFDSFEITSHILLLFQ